MKCLSEVFAGCRISAGATGFLSQAAGLDVGRVLYSDSIGKQVNFQ